MRINKAILILMILLVIGIVSSDTNLLDVSIPKDCKTYIYDTKEYGLYEHNYYVYYCNTTNMDINVDIAYCKDDKTDKIIFEHYYHDINLKDGTIGWYKDNLIGTYIHYLNETICAENELIIDEKTIDTDKCDVVCKAYENKVECDSKRDGNGDGKLSSGESGFIIYTDKELSSKLDIKSDSIWYKSLEDCIIK